MIPFRGCILILLLSAFWLFPGAFPLDAHAASSVYIPGVPSASSSAMGISCVYNYPGLGTVYCTNQSPGPQVSSGGVVSAGYQNRLMFVTPASYSWSVPGSITKVKAVVIGPGGAATSGGNYSGGAGGGYSEKTYTTTAGTAISVTVTAGGSQSSTYLNIGGVQISAAGGTNGAAACGTVSGGCGVGGDVNTCGGNSNANCGTGGAGAGGPQANGGVSTGAGGGGFNNGLGSTFSGCPYSSIPVGQYGGFAFGLTPCSSANPLGSNSVWWTTQDIRGDGGGVTGSNSYGFSGSDGGLGGGGGAGAGPNCHEGDGGFGGGGAGEIPVVGAASGGNGGIGGGGGGNCYNGCAGGNGIAIIYW